MLIKALCILGIKDKDGNGPIWPGSVADVNEKDGKRLVECGSAVEVAVFGTETARPAVPEQIPNGNTPNAQNAPEGPENGEIEGTALEDMSFADLKAYAQELGIETGKIRSKAAMIEAISAYAEDGIPADDLPDLSPQDVVDE